MECAPGGQVEGLNAELEQTTSYAGFSGERSAPWSRVDRGGEMVGAVRVGAVGALREPAFGAGRRGGGVSPLSFRMGVGRCSFPDAWECGARVGGSTGEPVIHRGFEFVVGAATSSCVAGKAGQHEIVLNIGTAA